MEEKTKLFRVVEFINYSTKEKRSADIVCTTHIRSDPDRGLVAKFMDGPSYSQEDSRLIRDIVKNKMTAPESWPEFEIKILAKTETYKEALKELNNLDKKEFVCTTDSEEMLVENTIQATNDEPNHDNDINDLFQVPGLNLDDINKSSDTNAHINASGSATIDNSRNHKRKQIAADDLSFHEAKKKYKAAVNLEEKVDMLFERLLELREDLHYLKNDIKDIKKNNVQTALCQETMAENLAEFGVNLPLTKMKHFDKLESLLPDNVQLQHSLKSALLFSVHLTGDLKKMVRQILSALLSRRVAMKFTAMKPKPNKRVLQGTNCYKIIEGLIPFKSTAGKEKYSKPEILNAVGYVLTRSYDWGNGRNERRKKKENAAPEE
ncbi:uncharacterized protein LOC122502221 [Leptopilina heterotoma]|uniref:uncharacterized protein LOC122502221 n=1 Tax=Leptopilina heterotoma TaxID=63436 RepID=UPI001CA89427|nr:uncharacterized protein LOC122502221 [Leptopilina heterotoma]XP_043468098.1 uncharacterized protein LOC122502221 [Leptopilina heterotoma]